MFTPNFGEHFQFDEHIFQMGWFNHQPDNNEHSTLMNWLKLIVQVHTSPRVFRRLSHISLCEVSAARGESSQIVTFGIED